MERIIHELVQGSPEWHQFRLEHDGASEAAAMLGLSKKTTRSELLRMKHTGIAKEFSDWVQENILDHGHAVEAKARPLVEEIIGDELYPATYSYGRLSASCDGLTMAGDTAFEHKQWAAALAESVKRGELPEEHQPQCQQVMHVTGAERLIFVVSDGTQENLVHMEVLPDPGWVKRIEAGWAQFHADLEIYTPPEVIPAAVARPTLDLPAVSIEATGALTIRSNLTAFGTQLNVFIEALPTKPETDQEFADCKAALGKLKLAEDTLNSEEARALSQLSEIEEMRREKKLYFDLARTTRLALEKLVTAREEAIKIEAMQDGKDKLAEHIAGLNKRLGKPYMPTIAADWATAIKSKRTPSSLREAVHNLLVTKKIEASEIADKIEINLNSLRELAADHTFLFADTAQIVLKANDDLVTLIKMRITEHKSAEEKRLEAERAKIRAEEEAKAAEKVQQEQAAAAQAAAEKIKQDAAAIANETATQPAAQAVQAPTGGRPQEPGVVAANTILPTPANRAELPAPAIWQAARNRLMAKIDGLTIAELDLIGKYIDGRGWADDARRAA